MPEQQLQLRDLALEKFLRGHHAPVQAVAYCSDLRYMASGASDGIVLIWCKNNKARPWTLQQHTDAVNALDFHPSGKQLASASRDRTVCVWKVSSQAKCSILRGHTGGVQCVRFSPDGRRLLTASDDKTIKVWAYPALSFLFTLAGHTNWVRSIACSPSGHQAVSGSDDNTVRVWDLNTRQSMAVLRDHADRVNTVAWHPEGLSFATAGAEGCIKVWRAGLRLREASPPPAQHFAAHDGAVTELAYHSSGRWLLSCALDAALRLWDLYEGSLHYTLHAHEGAVLACAFSPSGTGFASGGTDRRLMMWQASIGPTDAQKRGHTPSSTLSLAGTCEGSEMLEGQAVEGDEDLGQTTLSIQATAQASAQQREERAVESGADGQVGKEPSGGKGPKPAAADATAAISLAEAAQGANNSPGRKDLQPVWNASNRLHPVSKRLGGAAAVMQASPRASPRSPKLRSSVLLEQVVARLEDVDMRLRGLDTKVAASDACIQDIASRMAAMQTAG